MDNHCLVTEYEEIVACGQSVQSRGVKKDGTPDDELFMDDFELAFYLCGECGEEFEYWDAVEDHLAENLEYCKRMEFV